jgi:hypothetical protein
LKVVGRIGVSVSSQVRSEWEERDQHIIHILRLELDLPSSLASLELAASPFPLRSPNLLPLWRFGAAAGAAILSGFGVIYEEKSRVRMSSR